MATEPIRIPIRQVAKEITNVGPDMFVLLDDGLTMGKAKASDAIDKRAKAVVDQEIAALNLGTAAQSDATDFATALQGTKADTAVQPEDIGSAATADISDFATAAQGEKADSALQGLVPGDNVSVDASDPASPVISTPSVSYGVEQSLSVAQRLQAQDNIGVRQFTPQMFGIVDDPSFVLDQSAEMQEMMDVLPAGATIDFGSMRIRCASTVTRSDDVEFVGNGYVLKFTGAAMLTIMGSRAQVATVAAPAPAGSVDVTVSDASQITDGSVLILQNANSMSFYGNAIDARDYTDGEFIETFAPVGNVVPMRTRLKTSYVTGPNYKVFRLRLTDFRARGGRIEGEGAFVLYLLLCTGLDLDIEVEGGTTRAVYVNQCYKGKIDDGRYIHTATATGSNYGIGFANSQDIYCAPGVFALGTRHGIAMGGAAGDGAVPCRNIIVERARIANKLDVLHAADIHGWAVDCYYVDCDVDGGVGIGGLNCGAPGCTVIAKAPSGIRPVLATEVVGGKINLDGIKVRIAPGWGGNSIVGIASSAQFGGGVSVRDYHLSVNDLTVECTAAVKSIVNWLHNMPGDVKWTMSADRMRLDGDISGFAGGDQERLILLTVSNTQSHASPPIAADRVSQKGVMYKGTLPSITFRPRTSGGSGWRLEAPSSGSGPNGQWERRADGTQVCSFGFSGNTAISTDFLGGKRSGALSWTYEMPFAAPPEFQGTPKGATAVSVVGSTVGPATATFFLTAFADQASASRQASLEARGRWY